MSNSQIINVLLQENIGLNKKLGTIVSKNVYKCLAQYNIWSVN